MRLGKQGQLLVVAKTDSSGRFQMQNIPGGVYQLRPEAAGGAFRLWAPRTAPPAAVRAVMLVSGNEVVARLQPPGCWVSLPTRGPRRHHRRRNRPALALDDDDAS